MAQSTYKTVVLAQRPKSLIVPGETFSIETSPLMGEKDVGEGQVLVETLYLSLDPAMRGWLNGMCNQPVSLVLSSSEVLNSTFPALGFP
jgi:NADPH-dependent curcumin reductase CurA